VGMAAKLRLSVLPPNGGNPVAVQVDKLSSGRALKEQLFYITKASPDQLFQFRNSADGELTELRDVGTLEVQGVSDGATISAQRTGDDGDAEKDAKAFQDSISRHGRLSYFHTNRKGEPERIAEGGVPVKLATVEVDSVVRISNFTWADDGKNVKVYVEADQEPRAVNAAKDGKGGQVRHEFDPSSFTLTVVDDGRSFELRVPNLYREITPRECKCRVSEGKRITVTLRKTDEDHMWFSLTKGTAVEYQNAQARQAGGR